MNKMISKNLFLALLITLVSGCSANAFIQKVTPLESGLGPYNKVYVSVKGGSAAIESSDGFDVSKTELADSFISNLTALNKFTLVTGETPSNPSQGSLFVELVIEDFHYVSGASSVMLGIMSGNARLKVLAKITDAETGNTLGELRSGAQTSSSGGIFRGSTGTLIKEVAKKLAEEIASSK